MRFRSVVLGLACSLALVVVGCTSPRVKFYELPTPQPLAGHGKTTVVVGPMRIPQHLNRTNIAWRTGTMRLQFDADNRWGTTFQNELLRALTEHLSARLPKGAVLGWPAEVVAEDAVQVVIEVQKLDATADGPAYLRGRYIVRRGAQAEVIAEAMTTIEAEMRGDDAKDAVNAYSALIEELAEQIANAIGGQI